MNISRTNEDALNAVLTIEMASEDYQPKVDEVLRKHRKNLKMPGFRSGKVPMSMVVKMYGKEVKADEVNKLISEKMGEYIRNEKLMILGDPLSEDIEADVLDHEKMVFNFRLGLAPEFEISVSEKDKFTRYIIDVTDDMIESELDELQRRYGKIGQVDVAEEKDLIRGEFVELNPDGAPMEDGIVHTSTVGLEWIKNDMARKLLIGLNTGDSVDISPEELSDNDADRAAMLGIDAKDLPLHQGLFRMTAKGIYRMNKHELNQAFFNQLFPGEDIKDEAAFKARIARNISMRMEQESEQKLIMDIHNKLVDKRKLPLPDDFLKKWIKRNAKEEISDETLEKEYPAYAKELRWSLIESKLMEQHEVKVEHDEVREEAKGLFRMKMMRRGYMDMTEEELESAAHKIVHDPEQGNELARRIASGKLNEILKNTVTLKEKHISKDEFVKLVNEKPKTGLLEKLGIRK